MDTIIMSGDQLIFSLFQALGEKNWRRIEMSWSLFIACCRFFEEENKLMQFHIHYETRFNITECNIYCMWKCDLYHTKFHRSQKEDLIYRIKRFIILFGGLTSFKKLNNNHNTPFEIYLIKSAGKEKKNRKDTWN